MENYHVNFLYKQPEGSMQPESKMEMVAHIIIFFLPYYDYIYITTPKDAIKSRSVFYYLSRYHAHVAHPSDADTLHCQSGRNRRSSKCSRQPASTGSCLC